MGGGNKSLEIELKYLLPGPEAEQKIVEKMRTEGYRLKELQSIVNTDIYLDTYDWSLRKKNLALRYRTVDDKAFYTIKDTGAIEGGIAKRQELEVPLDHPTAHPADIPVKAIKNTVAHIIYPRKLLEHVQIRTNRRRYRLSLPGSAKCELAFDASRFSPRGLQAPRRAGMLHELEAELIGGEAKVLDSLSSLIAGSFGYEPSALSKLERAIQHLKIHIPSNTVPPPYRVHIDDRLDSVARKILSHQLNRFEEQLAGVRQDIDTEFVHQARVATRRMRSAVRLFRQALPKATSAYLAAELKWLGGLFGAVRDLDVFLMNIERFQGQIDRFPGKEKKVFEDWIASHRRAPLDALLDALGTTRYGIFERRLRRFLDGPLHSRPRAPLALKPAREAAPLLIKEILSGVMKRGIRAVEKPGIKRLHSLRIEMKRLRYACEFIAPAYDDLLDSFIRQTVDIQDCLGEIQDTVFTKGFIDYLFRDWSDKLVTPDLIFILGEIYQLQRSIFLDRQKKFSKTWNTFASQETLAVIDGMTAQTR